MSRATQWAKRILRGLALAAVASGATAQEPAQESAQEPTPVQQITNLDQLLQSVKEEQRRQAQQNRQREQEFLRDKQRQQALLKEAQR